MEQYEDFDLLTEFGSDADFSPYYAPGIMALDACTAYSEWERKPHYD